MIQNKQFNTLVYHIWHIPKNTSIVTQFFMMSMTYNLANNKVLNTQSTMQNQLSRYDHTTDNAKSLIYQYLKISHHWNSIPVIIHLLQITFCATFWWLCKLCINKIHKLAQHSATIPDTLNVVQNWPCAPSLSTWFKKWNQTGLPTKQDSSAAEGDTKRRKSQLIPNHLFPTNYRAKDP
jgi:hypothetical protein